MIIQSGGVQSPHIRGICGKKSRISESKVHMFRAILCQLIVCATASSATYFVSPMGNDRNPGTSEDQPFCIVQHAVDQMQAGDTLMVLDGVYNGKLKLKSGITIKAKNPRKVVFSGFERLEAIFEEHSKDINLIPKEN